MEEIVAGYVTIRGVNCTFFMRDFSLTLVVADPNQRQDEFFLNTIKVDKLDGITADGHCICFLKVVLKSGLFNKIAGRVAAYVIGRNNCSSVDIEPFHAITFTGEVVDRFYCPLIKYDEKQSTVDYSSGSSNIVLKSFSETSVKEQLGANLFMELCVCRPAQPTEENLSLGSLNSYLQIYTDKEWSLLNIIDLYTFVYHMFVIFNFRWNITFEEITLLKSCGTSCFEEIGEFHIASKFENTKITAKEAINYYDVCGCLPRLFQLHHTIERHLLFIPNSDIDANIVNFSRYVQTCSVFEGLFDICYPEARPRSNSAARLTIKNQLLTYISQIVLNTTSKEKRIARDYYDRINTADEKSLETQFEFVMKQNKNVLATVFPRKEINDDYIECCSGIFAFQRNHLDHGALEVLNTLEVSPFSIAVCLIYIMILKSIEVDRPKIINSLSKLFGEYIV